MNNMDNIFQHYSIRRRLARSLKRETAERMQLSGARQYVESTKEGTGDDPTLRDAQR